MSLRVGVATVCAAVVAIALAVPAGAATWSTPQNLGFQGQGPHSLALAAEPDGSFTALWLMAREVRFAVGSRRGVFSKGRRVPDSVVAPGKQLDTPQLAVGNGGNGILSWRSDARVRVTLVRRGHASKAASVEPATGVQLLGGVALGPRGLAAVAFRDGHSVYLSLWAPGRRIGRGELVAEPGTPVGCYFRAGRPVVVYLSGVDLLERTRLGRGQFSGPRRVGTVAIGEPTFTTAPTFATAADGTEAGVWKDGGLLTGGVRDPGRGLRTSTLTGSQQAQGSVAVASGGRALAGWTDGFRVLAVSYRKRGGRLGSSSLVPSVAASFHTIVAAVGSSGWGVLAWNSASSSHPAVSTGADAVLVGPRGELGSVTSLGQAIFPLGAAVGRAAAVVSWLDRGDNLRFAHARVPRR